MARIKDFLLFSEFSTALCALALGWFSSRQIQGHPNPLLLALLASASYFFYSLERNLTLPGFKDSAHPGKTLWIKHHPRTNLALLGLSAALSLALVGVLSWGGLFSLVVFGLLAASYSLLPLPGPQGSKQGLKGYLPLKPLLLVLVWTYLTLLLPWIEARGSFSPRLLWLVLIWVALIFSNSVLFDIRDISLDQKRGHATLASRLGKARAHRLIFALGLLQLGLFGMYGLVSKEPLASLGLCLAALAFLGLNLQYSKRQHVPLPFFLAADLTLTLPCLILWAGELWS